MMAEYMRIQLMKTAGPGPQEWECALCGGLGYELRRVEHEPSCILSDPSVTSVRLVEKRGGIDLAHCDGKWWWRSWTGNEYHIEQLAPIVGWPEGRFGLFDDPGGEIASRLRLSGIKQWIRENQGRL